MTTLYIGVMSGTSLDGADAVLADFSTLPPQVLAHAHAPFAAELRSSLLALQISGSDELHRAALAANALVDHYAELVQRLLQEACIEAQAITAIGAHGQTVRHQPQLAYTLQLNAPARLAEACGIDVIADFRSRDIAAGGHGAPLVPAFHAAVFAHETRHRVIVNIGGMANITDLPATTQGKPVHGWDCGPGNVLLDTWIARHHATAFDHDGAWAQSGQVLPELLERLQAEPWLQLPPPKSTGRDLFNGAWLDAHLQAFGNFSNKQAVDVQATLSELSAWSIADSIRRFVASSKNIEVIVCGGGARNADLMARLQTQLQIISPDITLSISAALGMPVDQVEALAFAWLARQFTLGLPGNLASVTGARGARILGALYPN